MPRLRVDRSIPSARLPNSKPYWIHFFRQCMPRLFVRSIIAFSDLPFDKLDFPEWLTPPQSRT